MKRVHVYVDEDDRKEGLPPLFDEVGGQPLNWGYTLCVIFTICLLNISILIGLRCLLDLRDDYDNPILDPAQQEIVLQITGAFALSFGFGCCCCFCCGAKCPIWTIRGITSLFTCCHDSLNSYKCGPSLIEERPQPRYNRRAIRPYVINTRDHQLTVSSSHSSSSGKSHPPLSLELATTATSSAGVSPKMSCNTGAHTDSSGFYEDVRSALEKESMHNMEEVDLEAAGARKTDDSALTADHYYNDGHRVDGVSDPEKCRQIALNSILTHPAGADVSSPNKLNYDVV